MPILNKVVKKLVLYYDITSISSWIMFERFHAIQQLFPSIEHRFKPVHSSSLLTIAGTLIPFSTPTLRKNYFEEQRLLARIHGISIGTSHEVIDKLLIELSNTLLPQCFMNMVAVQCTPTDFVEFCRILWRELWVRNKLFNTEEDLLRLLAEANIPIPRDEILFDRKWGKILDDWHGELLNKRNCFDIPWTILHFNDGTNKEFNGVDKWPIICSFLKIDQRQFGLTLPI